MQFDWDKFQQTQKTLEFQRHEITGRNAHRGIACEIDGYQQGLPTELASTPGPIPTNFAHNLPRSLLKIARKHCNSNDLSSMLEQSAGELRAKFLIDSQNWATRSNPGPGRTMSRRTSLSVTPRPTGVKGAGGSGEHGWASRRDTERSEALASRAAGPDSARNTSDVTRTQAGRPTLRATYQHTTCHRCGGAQEGRVAWTRCRWAAAGPGGQHTDNKPRPIGGRREACGAWLDNAPTRRATHQRPGTTDAEGAGGSGGHGRAHVPSPARLEAAARPAGPGRASRRRAELKARSADGERAGRPRGGRKSGG